MTDSEREKLRLKAEILKAIGQPIRLGIMELLDREEMHVGQLAERLCVDTSSIFKHLSILRKLGLVMDRRDVQKVLFRSSFAHAIPLWRCVENVVVQRLRVINQKLSEFPHEGKAQEEDGDPRRDPVR